MIYTTARTHARRLARDPNSALDDTTVLTLFQDVYTSYWETFLKDRVLFVVSLVTIPVNAYMANATPDVRDITSLCLPNAGPPINPDTNPLFPMERDDFDAVCVDSENIIPIGGQSTGPRRWGMRMQTGSNKPLIAIYPRTDTELIMSGFVYSLPNVLSTVVGAGDLQGTDLDGYTVARIVAAEIMAINGEDPADIDTVFKLLDQRVQDKYAGVVRRSKPRSTEDKEQ